jgi:hypothetical protein
LVDLRAVEEGLRLGRLSMLDRLAFLHESARADGGPAAAQLRVVLSDGTTIRVRPVAFGKDWFSADLVDEAARRSQCIVPTAGVAGLVLTPAQIERSLRGTPAPGPARGLSGRLGLGFMLRALCRRRSAVELHLLSGDLHGTIDRVGRDHLDLAVHEPGASRRDSAVTQCRLVPLGQILLVRL